MNIKFATTHLLIDMARHSVRLGSSNVMQSQFSRNFRKLLLNLLLKSQKREEHRCDNLKSCLIYCL